MRIHRQVTWLNLLPHPPEVPTYLVRIVSTPTLCVASQDAAHKRNTDIADQLHRHHFLRILVQARLAPPRCVLELPRLGPVSDSRDSRHRQI